MTEYPLSDDLIELIARRFRVLGEPMRIMLLDLLRGREASVQELTGAVGSLEQNVSKHLGVLRQAGIVRRGKRGNFSYYSIADAGVCSRFASMFAAVSRQSWSRSARRSA